MLTRLVAAVNSRDAHRLAALFADGYRSAQPVHPGRDFVGSAQVLENWTSVFAGVPGFVGIGVTVRELLGRPIRPHRGRCQAVQSGRTWSVAMATTLPTRRRYFSSCSPR